MLRPGAEPPDFDSGSEDKEIQLPVQAAFMFERYTEKARRTIFFARYEASQFASPYIESEHLLLGLLRENKNFSRKLFAGSLSEVEAIREQIERHTTVREKTSTSVDLPLSGGCKRVLDYASEEADRLGHKHIGTEHLLLGLLREESCYAAQLLQERGVNLGGARDHIAAGPPEAVASPPKSPGIPAGYSCLQLLYNPASETIIAEMNLRSGGVLGERLRMGRAGGPPFPPMIRLFVRHKDAEAYEQIGDPADDVSYSSAVTCATHPIVIFNSMKWDEASRGRNWHGLYSCNLNTKKLTLCVDGLVVTEPHLRSWIKSLVSLSDDGQSLYVIVGVEKAVPDGAVVHYFLASLGLADKKLTLLCQLQDIYF